MIDEFKFEDRKRSYTACRCPHCMPPSGTELRATMKTYARRSARHKLRNKIKNAIRNDKLDEV